MVQVGDYLWYINKKDNTKIDTVPVTKVTEYEVFIFYKGKEHPIAKSDIGKRLYINKPIKRGSDGAFIPAPVVSSLKKAPAQAKTWNSKRKVREKTVYVSEQRKNKRTEQQPVTLVDDPKPAAVIAVIPKDQTVIEKSCNICRYQYTDKCGSIRGELCEDYSPKPATSEEIKNWPEYGDATCSKREYWLRRNNQE